MSVTFLLRAPWLQRFILLEEADLEIVRAIDDVAVGGKPAVGDTEDELGSHHALEVDAVDDPFNRRHHLPGELHLAGPTRSALAGRAEPAEEEADHLPQRVQAQTARHDRISLEMAEEEPEVRLHVELTAKHALTVFPALLRDFGDAVEHQ